MDENVSYYIKMISFQNKLFVYYFGDKCYKKFKKRNEVHKTLENIYRVNKKFENIL
jgi:hypothetical protein